MGFFTDLKEDLSQAVNELVPNEKDSMSEVQNTAAQTNNEETAKSAAAHRSEELDTVDLEAMLNSIEKTEQPLKSVPQSQQQVRRAPEPIVAPSGNRGVATDETAVITLGMTISGDLSTQGSIELCGTVNGNIQALGKLNITGNILGNSKAAEVYAEGAKITGEVVSEGSVKIGQSSVIIGNISATSAVIAGAVKGDIDVRGPVILDTSAIVMGNIKSKSVQINNGAVIEGMCSQCYADVNPTSFFDEFKKMSKK